MLGSFDPDEELSIPELSRARLGPVSSDCRHSGSMIFVGDPVATMAWCDRCGQEWELAFKVDELGNQVPAGWRITTPGEPLA